MSRAKLDKIDRQILNDLQEDGRMTNVDLAKNAGISAPPCLRRVRTLEETGFIKGYHAEVDSKMLGYSVVVFAFVGLQSQAETDLASFEEQVLDWPLVRECYMLQGEADFMLKVVARDLESYNKFLTEDLTAAPNVANVKSALGIRNSKHDFGVPIDLPGHGEDNLQ